MGIWDKVPRNNKSHSQQSAINIPPHAIKLKKNPPSSLDDNKDKNQRKKPSSSGPSHLGKIIAPQTFIKKTNISASSTTMNNNTVQLSVAQNNLCPKRLQTVLQDGLSGIEKYYLQQKYKIPNNYSFMKAPSLNEEVFPFMDERAKILDSRLFNQQEMLSTCMAALLEGLASAPSGGGFRAAKENLHAGLHLLADLHNELTKARRNVIDSNLKSFLLKKIGQGRADFEDVNHDIKRDDTVFGREIGNLLRKELLEQFRQK